MSLSVINSRGQPFSQNHLSKKMVANSLAVMFMLQEAIWISALNLSVMVTIASKLLSLGSGSTKLIVTELNHLSGTDKGCSGPAGFTVQFLLR